MVFSGTMRVFNLVKAFCDRKVIHGNSPNHGGFYMAIIKNVGCLMFSKKRFSSFNGPSCGIFGHCEVDETLNNCLQQAYLKKYLLLAKVCQG